MSDVSKSNGNDKLAYFREEGLDWIGSLPESWDVVKLKYLVSISKVKSSDYDTFIGLEDVESWTGRYIPTAHINVDDTGDEGSEDISLTKGDDSGEDDEEQKELLEVKKGDVLFSKLRPYLAKCMISPIDAACSSEFLVFRDFKGDKRFLKYVMLSSNFIDIVNSSTYGTKMPRSNWDFIKNLPIPIFNICEQNSVANKLDQLSNEIDVAVERIIKQIELLKYYRTSVISDVVLHGVDNLEKLVCSTVDYIGDVPSSWSILPLKKIVRAPLQYGASSSGIAFDETLPRYIRITDILENSKLSEYDKKSLSLKEAGKYILEDGDILFARSGATVGKSFIYHSNMGLSAFAGYLICVRLCDVVIPEYLWYYTLTKSYDYWKNKIFTQSTIQNINANLYSNLEIPIPPRSEQIQIISYLNKFCSIVDAILIKLQKMLELLNQYRSSVILHSVTGQVRFV